MYKSMTRLSTLKFARNAGLTFSSRNPERTQICRRSSGLLQKKEVAVMLGKEELSFASFVHNRREQAKRSFMVKLNMDKLKMDVLTKLFRLCCSCGKIENIFRYVNNSSEYLLIEMNSQDSLNSVMEQIYEIDSGTVCSEPFIVLSDFYINKNKLRRNSPERTITGRDIINVKDVNKSSFLDREINRNVISLNEMISNCFHGLKISDFEIRKKFLMCKQIEVMCSGFLPNVIAYPFGSSVTGFGNAGCDLDIALLQNSKHNTMLFDQENSTETTSAIARDHLEIISMVMKKFMTGCEHLCFIRNAKVPIVKYSNTFTNVDCDLSLYNVHGIAISQILYSLASFDWRVRALVIFIKFWAQKVGVVYKSPGHRLTSFSLSLLVIFFLQQINMLPPWNIFPCTNTLYQLSESSALSSLCTFIKERRPNNKTVEELFLLFLEYYENFDFKTNGISLKEGKVFKNTTEFPLFIENPIFLDLNVSPNVTDNYVIRTQKTFAEALNILSTNKRNPMQDIFGLRLMDKRKLAAGDEFVFKELL